jgi:hypothetical protein
MASERTSARTRVRLAERLGRAGRRLTPTSAGAFALAPGLFAIWPDVLWVLIVLALPLMIAVALLLALIGRR